MVKDEGRYISKYPDGGEAGLWCVFISLRAADVAVADGSMEDEFFPIIRGPFKLSSRWSATVAKSETVNGKLPTLHLSSDVFTNTLIAELTRAVLYAGGAGLLAGGLAGWFLGRRRMTHRRM